MERNDTAGMEPRAREMSSGGLGLRARLLLRLARRLRHGRLVVVFPDGRSATVGDQPLRGADGREVRATVEIRRWWAVARLLAGGDVGFAESYIDGDWESPDLRALLELTARNQRTAKALWPAAPWREPMTRLGHRLRRNTRAGSRRNIAFHYDLGNAFYRRWLDDGMTYSAGLYETGRESLADAQENKYRRVCDWLELAPGMHVLEIGCGWGGFAEMAARDYGVRVTGVTLSRAQLAYARERIAAAGLEDRVELRLQDYRDIAGRFDAIASIEMIEAVGEENWPTYFAALRKRLKPGGRACLQAITIADARFPSYRRSVDFIQRHIFPGGLLPSPAAIRAEAAHAGLGVQREAAFGLSYAHTLTEWRRRFRASWPEIEPLGFDERFRRTWEYYLAYCEAGFRSRTVDVCHVLLAPAGTGSRR